jgi:tRNA C32,U32 (ribose-2'-O)-methylase TrmJ
MLAGGKTHYRRRRVAGHMRAIMSRANINTQEAQSLHGLVSRILRSVQGEDKGGRGPRE